MHAHDHLRELKTLAQLVINKTPVEPRRKSPRDVETRKLRSTRGGGGVARSEQLGNLSSDMQLMAAQLILSVDGVADTLATAATRENEVNRAALGYGVRPVLELAGQIKWLLTDRIDAEERARRYLVWRLTDLRAHRRLLRDFKNTSNVSDAVAGIDAMEEHLLITIRKARWMARESRPNGSHIEAARLLRPDGKPEQMPRFEELVQLIAGSEIVYPLLSITAHSQRFGVLHGVEVDGRYSDAPMNAQVGGFPIDINLLIGLTVLAVDTSFRLLGGWNGLDTTRLHLKCLSLNAMAAGPSNEIQ